MIPAPPLTSLVSLAAAPAAATVGASPAGAGDGRARRDPSAASFAGNLQAALAQAAEGVAAAAAIPAVYDGPVAIAPAADAAGLAVAAAPNLAAGIAAAPPVPGAGAMAAAPTSQDRATGGKPRSAGSPAAPATPRLAGPQPVDAQPTGLPVVDLPVLDLPVLNLVVAPPAAPQSLALSAPAATNAVPVAALGPPAAPTITADNARSGVEAALRTEAGSVGAQVTAAVGSAAEAATPMIALSAAPGAPAACLGKPLLPDVAATAGLRENSPAQQVVPALLSLTDASFGTHRLTLRLDPAELGQVEIRIDRPASGPAEIRIAAERPETLVLLQHDRHQLEQALDQAGISAGRQIEFQLAPRIEAGANPAAAGGSDASGESASGRHGFGSGGDHGEDNRQGRGDRAAETSAGAQKWLRAGVDITA